MVKRLAMTLLLLFMIGVMIPLGVISNNNPVEARSATDISLPPVTLPVATVTLPPIKIPGPTVTVTLPPEPGPTKIVTQTVPGPTSTVTISNSGPAPPPPTRTITQTENATTFTTPRQQPQESGTLDPETRYPPVTIPSLSPIERVGLGFLAVLAIAGLIILGMWAGYYLGFKESDAKETSFLKALLNR